MAELAMLADRYSGRLSRTAVTHPVVVVVVFDAGTIFSTGPEARLVSSRPRYLR